MSVATLQALRALEILDQDRGIELEFIAGRLRSDRAQLPASR
jgi:hypothetical protein